MYDNSVEIQTHLESRTKYVMNNQINQMIQNPSSRLDKYDQNRKHEHEWTYTSVNANTQIQRGTIKTETQTYTI